MNYMMRDIAKMLADRAEPVCQMLLPNGKREGAEWRCGDLTGNAGKSLGVHLTGPKAGVWADFASDAKGDLLDLWAFCRCVNLKEALKQAKDYLGVNGAALPINGFCKNYRTPTKTGVKPLTPEQKVWNYLTRERRLVQGTLDAYQIEEKDGKIVFPYIDGTDKLVNLKHLAVERVNNKKLMHLEAGCALTLFGWQAIPPNQRFLIICEGEIDAMTWHQWGFPALSVPNGCTSTQWVDEEWDNLAPYDTIYLCYDMDKEGQAGATAIAKRLGLHRCAIITLPRKDPNECLQWGSTATDAARWLAEARYMSPPQIAEPSFFFAKVEDYFRPAPGQSLGFAPSMFKGKLRLRAGEVTLLSGISGHGKSTLWSQILAEAIAEDLKCFFASLEIPPGISLGIMARQYLGVEDVPTEKLNQWLNWLAHRLWLFADFGTQSSSLMMEILRYCRSRHGVDIAVIDSMMKLDILGDDYNAQCQFLNTLTKFAMETGCHVVLVAHPRKGKTEENQVGKLDIKGSSDIFNQADNVIMLWRNKAKEEGVAKEKDKPDALVSVDKQRLTGIEFKHGLWFNAVARQFKLEKDSSPHVYPMTSE